MRSRRLSWLYCISEPFQIVGEVFLQLFKAAFFPLVPGNYALQYLGNRLQLSPFVTQALVQVRQQSSLVPSLHSPNQLGTHEACECMASWSVCFTFSMFVCVSALFSCAIYHISHTLLCNWSLLCSKPSYGIECSLLPRQHRLLSSHVNPVVVTYSC